MMMIDLPARIRTGTTCQGLLPVRSPEGSTCRCSRAQRKAEKELEIKRKYEAEPAALQEDSSTLP